MVDHAQALTSLARLPLRWRRRVIRSWWRVQCATGRVADFQIDRLLQSLLRVSATEARRLNREAVFQDLLAVAEWGTLLRRSRRQINGDAQSITISDTAILQQIARSTQPVILAPIHMGCFALPFARLMQDYFSDRRMLILRAREDRPVETAVMQRISEMGIDMRFLNVNQKHNYLNAIRFARAGAVIVSFVDLPASYGAPARVRLFGQPVRLAMGIGSLGRLTEATILPLSVRSSTAGDEIHFSRPFQTFETGPAEKARVTDIIRRHIESSVTAAPEQWHMWTRFDEFRDPDPSLALEHVA